MAIENTLTLLKEILDTLSALGRANTLAGEGHISRCSAATRASQQGFLIGATAGPPIVKSLSNHRAEYRNWGRSGIDRFIYESYSRERISSVANLSHKLYGHTTCVFTHRVGYQFFNIFTNLYLIRL